jgi:hypothetical protein
MYKMLVLPEAAAIRVNDTLNNEAGNEEAYSGYAEGIPVERYPSRRQQQKKGPRQRHLLTTCRGRHAGIFATLRKAAQAKFSRLLWLYEIS